MINELKRKIASSNIGSRLAKGISWSMVGAILGKGLMLIAFMFVARIIGKEEYGKVGMIRSTITMFMTFSSAGMGLTASRYIAYYRNKNGEKTYQIYRASNLTALFFAVIISLLVFFFSDSISQISFGSTDLAIPLRIGVLTLLFTTISSAQNGALSGLEKFKAIGVNTLISGFLQSILLIVGARYMGLNGVVYALGASAFILYLLYRKCLSRIFTNIPILSVKEIFSSEIRSIFIRFSIPAVFSGLVSIPVLWWTKTFLVKAGGFEEMAIFDVAEQWNIMLLFIPSSISGIILPLLTNTLSVGTRNQYNKLIKINLLINIGITLLLVLIISPFSPYILKLYGETFTNYLPLRIMLFTAILQAANAVLGQVIASKGKMWIGLGVNVLWGIWLIVFTYIFIARLKLGAVGLSFAMLVSYILHSIVQGLFAFKIKI